MTNKLPSKIILFVVFCLLLLVSVTAALLYHASQNRGVNASGPPPEINGSETQQPRTLTPATLTGLNKGNNLGNRLEIIFDPATRMNAPAGGATGFKPNYYEFARVHSAAAEEFLATNSELQLNRFAKAHQHFEQFQKYIKTDMNNGRKTDSDMYFYSIAYGLIGMAVAELKEYDGALQQLQTAIWSAPEIQDNYIVRANVFKLMGNDRQFEVWRGKALQANPTRAFPTWAQNHELCQMPPASK